MSPQHRFKQPPAFLAATVSAFLAVGLTGCSTESEEYVYCIDEDGQVVDPDLCEDEEYEYSTDDDGDDSTSYWYYVSSRRYSVGSYVPSDYRSSRISPSNDTARAAAGLPRTGKVGGTTISSGGFGSGSGSGRSGGYSGGGS